MTPAGKEELNKQIAETAKVTGSLRRDRKELYQLSAKLSEIRLALSITLISIHNLNMALSKGIPFK